MLLWNDAAGLRLRLSKAKLQPTHTAEKRNDFCAWLCGDLALGLCCVVLLVELPQYTQTDSLTKTRMPSLRCKLSKTLV